MPPRSSHALTQLSCVPHPFPPLNCCLPSQVQKVSLNPTCQPHPSFTSHLVPPTEPSPDAVQPAKLPTGNKDPSVSASGRPHGLFNLF